jgi:TolB-like protein/Tfp pilus assembly protein PilF
MSDVFVSYKAEDRARVRPLVDALEADGLSVWWDAHIGGGDDWRDTIARHLDDARCVIVVWSKRSVGPDGRFVRDEATRAQKRGAYLPVRIDKVDPPLGFGESQAIALNNWKGDRADPRYAALLAAARPMIGLEPRAAPPATAPRGGVSRRALLGGGAVILAAAAGGYYFLSPRGGASNSIAVLPFANLSGDPAQAYFSDGIAEELRNALSRIAGLKVVARTSSEMLRDADATTAARKLDVANILTGSVRRSASTIRVSAQLVDGRNGLELWSQSFDRPFGDVLQIQSGIAASVADALSIRLGSKDRAALAIGGTRNAAAQDLLLKAAPARTADSEAGLLHSISLIDAAIALDPNYAEAWARKGLATAGYAGTFVRNPTDYYAKLAEAKAAARRAIAIEPRLAIGHAALGAVYRNELNMKAALAELEQAVALPGANVPTLTVYGSLLNQIGRPNEAFRVAETAGRLNPLDPLSAENHLFVLFQARRYPEALASARHALQTLPSRNRIHTLLANTLLMLGKKEEARREYLTVPPENLYRMIGLAFVAAREGDRAGAERQRQLVVDRYGDSANYQYAQMDAQIGNLDRAFSELELAWKFRDPGLASIKIDAFVDPLRNDPRFAAVMARLNFP